MDNHETQHRTGYHDVFDDALEGERTQLLTELADAVSETRTAADQAAELNEDGERACCA